MAVIPSPGLILPISDRVDLVQGNPPLSPTGIARIAMIAGVPSVSINGGAYASFGSAGSAPSGTVQPQVRYLPTDHLDFIMGDPPVSPKGCGRLAVTTAGVASVSIESAAYASLGVSGAASTGCQLFPGFLYSTDYVDIVQGNPAVSLPGTARIACFTGATTLSISINGAAYVSLGSLAPPGAPRLWFDAQNIDGTNNSSLVDGQTIGTWVNLGSAGAGGNATQATAGVRPFFRLVAAAGKLNNKSGVQSDGTRFMSTPVLSAIAQPSLIAALLRSETIPALEFMIGDATGAAGSQELIQQSGTAQERSSPTVLNIGTMQAAKFHSMNGLFNIASSQGRVDGVAGSVGTVGSGTNDGMTLFANAGGGSGLTGYIIEALSYVGGGLPTAAAIEAYFVTKYGVTPQ
jgi:hypothetical protein